MQKGVPWYGHFETRSGVGMLPLCLLSEDAHQAERTRLIRLFTASIRSRQPAVPAAELFDFRV